MARRLAVSPSLPRRTQVRESRARRRMSEAVLAAENVVTRSELPEGGVLVRTARGELAYKRIDGVLFVADAGILELPAAQALVTVLAALRADTPRPLVVSYSVA